MIQSWSWVNESRDTWFTGCFSPVNQVALRYKSGRLQVWHHQVETHRRLLNRNFIAIYWFEYRTGLHLLTLWNTVTLESAGGNTDRGGGTNTGSDKSQTHRKWSGVEGEGQRGNDFLLMTSSQSSAKCSDWHFWIVFLKKRKKRRGKQQTTKGDKIMGTSQVATQEAKRLDWWRPWERNIDSDDKIIRIKTHGINMHKPTKATSHP